MAPVSTDHVFISYSRRDDESMRRIVSFLRGRGIKVWVDNERLVPGTAIWEEEIEKAIYNASAVIVVLSPDAKGSEWVRREITLTEQHGKRIFPVLVRGSENSSISLRLITRQFVDLRQNEEAGLNSLSTAILFYLEELGAQEVKNKEGVSRLEAEERQEQYFDDKEVPAMEQADKATSGNSQNLGSANGMQKISIKPSHNSRMAIYFVAAIVLLICLVSFIARYNSLQNALFGIEPKQNPTGQAMTTNTATSTYQAGPTEQPSRIPEPMEPLTSKSVASIAVTQANMYKGPALEYGIAYLQPYKRGEKITVLARNPSGLWLYGKASDGNEGWLYIEWVDLKRDSSLLIPTASYIPPWPSTPTRRPGSQQSACNPPPDCGGGPFDPNTCQCQ